jgi:high-affinity K+ transport system ATPase subunit B
MSLEKKLHRPERRRTPEDIHAQLILIIGTTLAFVFLIVTLGITYALIFVTQPIGAQAPNDAAFIDLLKTLAIFLTGSLGGVLAGNGLKSKSKPPVDTPKDTRES